MGALLLTWNPGRDDAFVWTPLTWQEQLVGPTMRGTSVETSWGVGNHVNNIAPGDTAWLYRQGPHGRGIVARGVLRSHPWAAPHWDEARARQGVTTNCVDVSWQDAVPVDLAIDVDELEGRFPEFAWRKVYSSGRPLPRAVARDLDRVWRAHLGDA